MNAPGKNDNASDDENDSDRAQPRALPHEQGYEEREENVEVLLNCQRPQYPRASGHFIGTGIKKNYEIVCEIQNLSRQAFERNLAWQQSGVCEAVRNCEGNQQCRSQPEDATSIKVRNSDLADTLDLRQ